MSAKGTTWGNHKYIRIENGRYIYADSKSAKSSSDKKAASAMASLLANYKKNKGVRLGTGKTASSSGGKSGSSKEKKEKETKEKESTTTKTTTEKKIIYKSVDDIKKFYKQNYSILPKDPKDGGKKETLEDEEQKKKKPKLIKHADDCFPYISDGKYFTETSFVPYL